MAKKEPKPKTRSYGIRTNVILGFTFAFLAVVAAGYFTYESTTRLLNSVVELSRPDEKLTKLREVLTDLTETENNLRFYALLKDEKYFNNYLYYISRADKNIDTLKTLTTDHEEQHRKVRQISVLLNTRLRNIDEFMVFKRAADTVNLVWRALEELRASPYDTTRTHIYTRTSTTTSLIDTLRIEPVIPPPKEEQSKGFFARIASLFSGKEVEKVTEIPIKADQVLQETMIVRDTSIVVQADTVLMYRIMQILTNLKEEESRVKKQLFEKELELLQNNSLIIAQIMEIISGLEQDEVMLANQQTYQAKDVAGRSVLFISAIMLSSFFVILIFLFLILRAISRSNYLRNQLIIAKQKAEQLAKVKEEFLATMSHEIRTPLNSIIGFSEQLGRTRLNHEQTEQLDAVKLSSEHLLSLVNDILDFSKLEQGKLRLENISFTVKQVIEETYKTFWIRAREKGIRLGYHIEFDGDMLLSGDPLRLKQILFNLVGNAIKFTQKGKVFVLCGRVLNPLSTDHHIRIRFEVHDTGIGIQPENLEAIFEGFTQADSSLSRRFGGTGLGLTISKKLVEMQGGIIGVASEAGKGSVFHFEIPYLPALAASDPGQSVTAGDKQMLLKDKTILLVDDDRFNVKLTTMILERWGMKIDYALSGKDALELISNCEYDLVLTDIHMPDMSGIELTQRIRAISDINKASVPIVAITANVMSDELDHYMKSGLDDYILKPYRETELFAKLADQLGFDLMLEEAPQSDGINLESQIEQVPENEFDLNDVSRFSGGNKKAMADILHSFIVENTRNIESLDESLNANNYPAIAELAHKMLTSYGHLGLRTVTDELRKLEKLDGSPSHVEVKQLIELVQKKSTGIFQFIQEKARELEEQVV